MHFTSFRDVIDAACVRTVFQPIVHLDSGAVVAYEALTRGPAGEFERPDLLFAAARRDGLLAELDELCRESAVRSATAHHMPAGVPLFVNIEPQVLDVRALEPLIELAAAAPGGLDVVLEITERAISSRPAELLSSVRRLRQAGWRIALDDVGADDMSLAFMPLLKPDVVKLDLRLVQERPGPAVAQIMNAVNAYAQRSGAQLLAEGIETEHHLQTARALGAHLGQGWMFGRPADTPTSTLSSAPIVFGRPEPASTLLSPFGCLPPGTPLRTSTKPLLIELSKHLEQQALTHGATCVVVSTFQYAHHFTPRTAARYERLAAQIGFVAALGDGLPAEPAPGVRGAPLDADDTLRGEWDITILAPHFSAALLARDLGDTGADTERRFEFALTYDRAVVSHAAEALLSRVAALPVDLTGTDPITSRPRAVIAPSTSSPSTSPAANALARAAIAARLGDDAAFASLTASPESVIMLHRALEATTNGVCIADVTRPDQPLVYVNAAFERLSGLRADQVLGTNCRLLQGPGTDREAVERIGAAIKAGLECRETIRNYRQGTDEPWWNEIHLAPIRDEAGRVVQYVGVQNDVTARVEAQLALEAERARSRNYLAELEALAYSDPLTGLRNRRGLPDALTEHIDRARVDGESIALLYVDVDGFKTINDSFGHATGDSLLREIGQRLLAMPAALRARIGGDEFIVVVDGLSREAAQMHGMRLARELRHALRCDVAGRSVSVSVGVSTYPDDGADFDALLHAADVRMYDDKAQARPA